MRLGITADDIAVFMGYLTGALILFSASIIVYTNYKCRADEREEERRYRAAREKRLGLSTL